MERMPCRASGEIATCRECRYLGIENVRLIEHDAADLDLPEASIDVVVSNLGINNFANADAVLRTCFRVTKPGGRLLLTANLVGHMQEFYDVYRATLMELELADRLATLDAHMNHRATLASIAAQLARAGFALLAVATDSYRMRCANGSSFLRHAFVRLAFLPAWTSVVPPEAVARTFTVSSSTYSEERSGCSVWQRKTQCLGARDGLVARPELPALWGCREGMQEEAHAAQS